MRARIPVVGLLVLPLVVGLSGCGPAGSGPDPSGTSSESPSPDPTGGPLDLPDDAVLAVSGVATAENGATADILVVVHAPVRQGTDEASEATTATLEWCVGEVDADVIAAHDYWFVTVDVSVTATSGDWPADAQLLAFPVPGDPTASTLAVSPGVHQVEIVDPDGEGAYVPHCLQPAFLDGAGAGSLYLGVPGGGDAWLVQVFGLSAELPGGLGTTAVTFADCMTTVTDLGADLGVPGAGWQERFEAARCTIGVA